ncbi:5-oxoprolinase subunit PxpB [Helicobacter baculiformis]|uniref:5-oxoprolinase subunit PxpB n=1 Tax=Helicobacter baculiformis TaxID=427351 RepID=A0ABV7ZEK5_9HELI|nr:5-oxoprolinase subunit PxpB [Helicobacter baculiformis]
MQAVIYRPCGESALLLEFGAQINPQLNAQVRHAERVLKQKALKGVLEIVSAYASLLILYDPLLLSYAQLVQVVENMELDTPNALKEPRYLVEIPTCYHPSLGLDLDSVSQHTHLPLEEIIQRHSAPDYLVYMLGFLPGFAYLGGLDPSLAVPRLAQPRAQVSPGSVGIAHTQTGIYPLSSPGGWQIIAKTPLKLYDPSKNPPVLLQAGDFVRYKPISLEEYTHLAQEVQQGTYQPPRLLVEPKDLHV